MGRIWREFARVMATLFFRLCHPASGCARVRIGSRVQLGKGARLGRASRVYVNAKEGAVVLGSHAWTGEDVELQVWEAQRITIEDHATVQDRCKILGDVTIGAYSTLAPQVFISSGNHQIRAVPAQLIKKQDVSHPNASVPVNIGEDVWIGVNAFVQAGVNIARGAVIGANSVVTENVGPYEIVGGVPARNLGRRLEYKPPTKLDFTCVDHRPYFYAGFDHWRESALGLALRGRRAEIHLQTSADGSELHLDVHNDSRGDLTLQVQVGATSIVKKFATGAQRISIPLQVTQADSYAKIILILAEGDGLYVKCAWLS